MGYKPINITFTKYVMNELFVFEQLS